ncbi:LLM class F420-dependent oxidoreductase [Spongiactinospora sp. TRM90649]|uniref:LLM class F420-dependent oxidoreductase n=1 Tax=Spongiactinospora sp. TRM90649 TaxID=3031114 RepID=UPI0023F7A9BF|nr:LLM class F420-dependent oxidoreductase [Spongiactinospora sp. TRM90649]MDF5758077.1 LLM class F420-dependent oxidoreductase [Spongiactinospora sp. TRM90649]
MKFGLAVFSTDRGLMPGDLARTAEENGFESLFFPEHTHMPVHRTAHFLPEGGDVPVEYRRTLDPFVALTAAACATRDLKLGTGICLVTQRDPITTAKEVATLDHISGGRFLFGVAAGWNREEMRNHGTDPRRRLSVMADRIAAMRAIWTQDEASYQGPYVSFDRIESWPKPVQAEVPILIGGNGPTVIDRVLSYGTEWLPESRPDLVGRIAEYRARAREAGWEDAPVTVFGCDPDDVARYEEAGVHRCVFWIPPNDASAAHRRVGELTERLGLDRPATRS